MALNLVIDETVKDEGALVDLLHHIGDLIDDGMTSGLYPHWHLVTVPDVLTWESAGNDGADDQTAATKLVENGFWSLGHQGDSSWQVELVVKDTNLADILADIDYLFRMSFDGDNGEKQAKQHAEDIERNAR